MRTAPLIRARYGSKKGLEPSLSIGGRYAAVSDQPPSGPTSNSASLKDWAADSEYGAVDSSIRCITRSIPSSSGP